jgi:hypothetical protein
MLPRADDALAIFRDEDAPLLAEIGIAYGEFFSFADNGVFFSLLIDTSDLALDEKGRELLADIRTS